MAKGRWKLSSERIADEAYLVLIRRQKASKKYSKLKLVQLLAHRETSAAFLRLSLEFDDSETLVAFRKALLFAIQALGVSKVTKETGLNRVTLYRMLSPAGNPSIRYLTKLSRYFGLRMWLVDDEFINRRKRVERPKSITKDIDAFERWLDSSSHDESAELPEDAYDDIDDS